MNTKTNKLIHALVTSTIIFTASAQAAAASNQPPGPGDSPYPSPYPGPMPVGETTCNGFNVPNDMKQGSWMFMLNFASNVPNACMITWQQDNVATKTVVPCTNNGGVAISNSIAKFNGANYVECPFQLGKFFTLPAEVTYDNLRMETKWVTMGELPPPSPLVGPSKYFTPNPVINHPNFKMVLTRKPQDANDANGDHVDITSIWNGQAFSDKLNKSIASANNIDPAKRGWTGVASLRILSEEYTVEHVSRSPNGANFASGYHTYKLLNFNPQDTTLQVGKMGNDYLRGSLDHVMLMYKGAGGK